MKPIYARFCGALTLGMTVAACVPAPDSTPAPTPTPTTVATPPAADQSPNPPPAPMMHDNWMDAPRTPGNWTYRAEPGGSITLYGEPQSEARFSMRCDRDQRRITLMRAGRAAAAVPLRIRTETADRTFDARPTTAELPTVGASLPASDSILDAMALTNGRFAVATPGMPTLYLPAWAEVTRVIEDCR